jgi:hypothetical protein
MWAIVVSVLVVGYLTCGRSFAYIGVPPLKLFVGEIVLLSLTLFKSRETLDKFLESVSMPGPLHAVGFTLLMFLADGFLDALRGISLGFAPLATMENLVFNVYPLYLFAGLWIGSLHPHLLRRTMLAVAWANGIYGVLYVLCLHKLPYAIPGTYPEIAVFGQPAGSAIALLGLLCLEKNLVRHWLVLALNSFVLLAIQVRAEFFGVAIGLILWAILEQKLARALSLVALVAVFLAIGFELNFSIPAPETRGGRVDARYITGRLIAPFDEQLAARLTPIARGNAGTAKWRTDWWNGIWDATHQDTPTAMFGQGYGFPLSSLAPYIKGEVIRTPHNAFFYALGYTGWIGVAVLCAFQLALAHLLWSTYRLTGQPFGLVIWAAFICIALFGNVLETPFGAIPLYLLTGLAAAPLLQRQELPYAHLSRTQLLPTAGW